MCVRSELSPVSKIHLSQSHPGSPITMELLTQQFLTKLRAITTSEENKDVHKRGGEATFCLTMNNFQLTEEKKTGLF